MSATTENLITEIKQAEEALVEAKKLGSSAAVITTIEANLFRLRSKLASAAEALNEGKQILKG